MTIRDIGWEHEPQESGVEASLRGLSVVDDCTAWASGENGTWLRTTDGGLTWENGQILGGEAFDFRDVHAFDASSAIFLSAGSPTRIYRTDDAGRTFELTHEDNHPDAFFDAFDFWDADRGAAFGDPVDASLAVLLTEDGGRSWTNVPAEQLPATLPGEAGFAASGTCLVAGPSPTDIWIGLGGQSEAGGARMYHSSDAGTSWIATTTTLTSSASSGVFSIDFRGSRFGVLVGGNYRAEEDATSNALRTLDGGRTWRRFSGEPPRGYRSAVAFAPQLNTAVCVGPTGADQLVDDSWEALFDTGYHAIAFAPVVSRGTIAVGWCAGAEGRIARIEAIAR